MRGLETGYEGRMRGLEKNYESVLVELVGFQRGAAQQDGVVKSLIMRVFGHDTSEFSFSSIRFFFVALLYDCLCSFTLASLFLFFFSLQVANDYSKLCDRLYALHLDEQKATSTTLNRNLTTTSTAGLLLPIPSASSSGKLEDGPGHYQHRNRTPSLPLSSIPIPISISAFGFS